VPLGVLALVLTLLSTPLAAEAQQAGKTPRIGVLFVTSPSVGSAFTEALRSSLRDLGYVEGRTITFESRSAEGRADRLPALAAELVQRKVDVIVTGGGNVSTLVARKATTTIPIVMVGSVGAVESGLVESLARPGGNVTGLTVPRELGLKQLELLRAIIPSLSRVVIFSRSNFDTSAQRTEAKAMALQLLGVTLDFIEVQEPEDLARAFATARASRPNAVIVGPDPLFFNEKGPILAFARETRLPTIYPFRSFVDDGGLVSYSLSAREVARIVARYVDRILKGAKPAELPVEQPTTFELVINLKTAKALGLTIPPSVLLRADHIIE
jgi:putative ABC transport system substrate-binding protein